MSLGKIGISSFSFPVAVRAGMRPLEVLQFAASQGVPVVQLADNVNLERLTREELKELADFAREHGLELEAGFKGLSRERIPLLLDINRRLDSRMLRIVAHAPGISPAAGEVAAMLEEMVPLAEKEDILLGLETHDAYPCEEYAAIVKRVDSPRVGIVLDPVNCLSNEERPLDVAVALAPYSNSCHLKDYIIRRRTIGSGLEIFGTALGQGRADISGILQQVREHAPLPCNVIHECWAESFEPSPGNLQREQQMLLDSLAYLRNCMT